MKQITFVYQVNQSVNYIKLKPQHSAAMVCSLSAGLYHSVRQMVLIQRFSAGRPLVTVGVLIKTVQSYREQESVESLPALDDQVCAVVNGNSKSFGLIILMLRICSRSEVNFNYVTQLIKFALPQPPLYDFEKDLTIHHVPHGFGNFQYLNKNFNGFLSTIFFYLNALRDWLEQSPKLFTVSY